MKKIHRLKITIDPWVIGNTSEGEPRMELRVQATVNGQIHTTIIGYWQNDFESRFDHMMLEATSLIKKLAEKDE